MDLWATKDRHERETEESQRLVRPAPKLKPPRKDLRREDMRPDQDPDIDGDPDIAKDKDLSLNFKNIGGSIVARVVSRFYYGHDPVALRVAARFVQADIDRGGDDYVSVVRKDTGEHTRVKKETLKEKGSEYEVVEDEEGKKEEGEKKPGPSKEETAAKVRELAEKNPRLKGVMDTLADPKHKEHTTLTSLSDLPLASILKDVEFPEGVKTVGDLQAIAQGGAKEAPAKEPGKGKGKKKQPAAPAPAPAAEKPAEKPAPAAEKKPDEEPKDTGAEKAPAGAPPGALPETKTETEEGKSEPKEEGKEAPAAKEPEDTAGPERWLATKGYEDEDFKAWAADQPTVTESENGPLFPMRGTRQRVPFEKLSPDEQEKVFEDYDRTRVLHNSARILKELAEGDPKAEKALRDLANPESALRQKIDALESEAKQKGLDLSQYDTKKAIPELANVKLPAHLADLEHFRDAAEKAFAPSQKTEIPEPQRPQATKQAEHRAEMAIEETLPEDLAEHVASMGLHPHDVSDLLSGYKAAMNMDLGDDDFHSITGSLAAGGGYNLNPETIEPPEEFELGGKKTKFADLSPEDQSEVFAKYKMHVLATSLAARERVTKHLEESGLPEHAAKVISEAMLKSTHGKDGLDPNTVQQFFSHSLASAFADQPMDPVEVQEAFRRVGDNKVGKQLVAAYVQANNYSKAREQFLSGDRGHDQITEYDDPAKIARKLQKASEMLKDAEASVPEDVRVVDPAMEFRNRVIDRMSALAPEKVPVIRAYLQDYEMEDFENKERQAKKLEKEYKKALQQEEKTRSKELSAAGESAYRSPPPEELEQRLADKGVFPPQKPVQPPGYDHWKNRKDVEKSSKSAFEWLRDKLKGLRSGESEERAKEASTAERVAVRTLVPDLLQRVACRYELGLAGASYSSYPGCSSMGQESPGVRTAIYWGQEPYEQTAPYPGWSQLHARDFGAQDFDNILKAAREWLKLPVLGREIKGLYPDTQLRAALDLAIRDLDNGKYSVGLYPTVYNELLARLSNRPGPYELLTGKPDDVPVAGVKSAGKSTYGATTERGSTMKASVQVRSFAARAASATPDPELAFDLSAFADHLAAEEAQGGQQQAGQEQAPAQQAEAQKQAAIRVAATQMTKFNSVRSLIIRQAAQNPAAREAFLPILQALK